MVRGVFFLAYGYLNEITMWLIEFSGAEKNFFGAENHFSSAEKKFSGAEIRVNHCLKQIITNTN
ncbi:MAG: hypothetical protein IJ637_07740 [Prevotella sp.]|nr:hypothetical protein [Prevotella sp.]